MAPDLGFMVMGFVSGFLWMVILTQGSSWWLMHHSARIDYSKKCWEAVGHMEVSF